MEAEIILGIFLFLFCGAVFCVGVMGVILMLMDFIEWKENRKKKKGNGY